MAKAMTEHGDSVRLQERCKGWWKDLYRRSRQKDRKIRRLKKEVKELKEESKEESRGRRG